MSYKLNVLFRRFLKDESGLSAVEYGLLAAGIAVGLFTIISDTGSSLKDIYGSVRDDLSTAAPQ
jgi:pilus assembly protein Flp/PilA